MIKNWVVLFVAIMLLFISGNSAFANVANKPDQKLIDRYILDCVKKMRVKNVQPQPKDVKEFHDKYTEVCHKRAEEEYEKHGRWFYCRDKQIERSWIRSDEGVSYRTYWRLLESYGSLEKIPNYSKKNHEEAIKFWQSWQLKDGSFRNVFTKKGNGNDNHCNGKYVVEVMKLLGCEPLYKTYAHGTAEVDTKEFIGLMGKSKMNHGTALAWVLFKQIEEGRTENIPVLERGLELGLSHISKHTGMFQGADANPQGAEWKAYKATADTMKGLLRYIAYMGTENIPYRHKRADTLIANQDWFRQSNVSVKRNTAEMMIQCLMDSPYRSDELLKAFDGHSKVILEGDPSQSHGTGDYTSYIMMMFGSYLHWEGYEESTPRTPFSQGVEYGWRVEAGPFGRCINLIRKSPEEILGHKDFSYAKHSLRARNAMHEKRKVIDVVAASSSDWAISSYDQGQVEMKRTFTLGKEKLQNPYLKIKWSGGDIEILLNGVLVKKKLGGLAEFGAVHIPDEARKTLKEGTNTLVVRTVGKASELSVNAGIIDWK